MTRCTVQSDGWLCAGPVDTCPPNGVLRIHTERFRIAVYHTTNGLVAIKDHCPHADAQLSRGAWQDNTISCPAHNWKFSLPDGDCIHGGPEDCQLRTFPVEIRDGAIWVHVRNIPRPN